MPPSLVNSYPQAIGVTVTSDEIRYLLNGSYSAEPYKDVKKSSASQILVYYHTTPPTVQ